MNYSPLYYIYQPSGNPEAFTLLLLHGTGGTEKDLLPLVDYFGTGFNVLSVRGNVQENGMPRFFKRKGMGIFDEEDLQFRTSELHQFLEQIALSEKFDASKIVALGYSNGANIAGSMLILYPEFLYGAILFRPMPPFRDKQPKQIQKAAPIFIANGSKDPTVDQDKNALYAKALGDAGFSVQEHQIPTGHHLTQQDLALAAEWFQTNIKS